MDNYGVQKETYLIAVIVYSKSYADYDDYRNNGSPPADEIGMTADGIYDVIKRRNEAIAN